MNERIYEIGSPQPVAIIHDEYEYENVTIVDARQEEIDRLEATVEIMRTYANEAIAARDAAQEALAAAESLIAYARSYHEQTVATHGMTDGFCSDCDQLWPCQTLHSLNGWGSAADCEEGGWCGHAGVKW